MYKLFLILRYLRKRRIALFAVVSVWLCTAMVLIVISVMGGFLDMVRERSRGLLGDLIVDNASLQGFPFYQEFIDELYTAMAGQVDLATPVIYNYGILRMTKTDWTKPVRVVGIRLEEYKRVNDFANSLYYDKYYPGTTTLGYVRKALAGYDENGYPALPPEYEEAWQKWKQAHPDDPEASGHDRKYLGDFPGPGRYPHSLGPPGYAGDETDEMPAIIIGSPIINDRQADGSTERYHPRGHEAIVSVMPITPRGSFVEGGKPLAQRMRYIDDSQTGVYEIDTVCVYVDFDNLQQLLDMNPQELEEGGFAPARASQILVKLKPGQNAKLLKPDVQTLWQQFVARQNVPADSPEAQLLSYVDVETWEERQAPYIAAVEKEKVLMTILFGVISTVAVVLIGCIFYMIVSHKTRDIGIIKSLGASWEGVAVIFIGFGAVVGLVGAILGTATGAVFVHYINEIQNVLAKLNPILRVWSPDVYTFDRIPNVVKISEALTIGISAVVLSMVGAIIPARMAARVWPARALRYE